MNVRLITKCSQCWASQNYTMGICRNFHEPRIEWDFIPDTVAIIRVKYSFLSEKYQKEYVQHGNHFPLVRLFDIIGAITGIEIIFRFIYPFYLLQTDSNPINLSNEQIYEVRYFLGSKSYLYGENSAF